MIHHLWTPNGRVLDLENGQRRYVAQAGQRNVLVGNTWAPFHWDPATGICRYGEMELQVNGAGVEFRHGANILQTSFGLEERRGPTWTKNDQTAAAPTFEVIDTLRAVAQAKISIPLESGENGATVSIFVGGGSRAKFAYDLRAKRAGRHRISWNFGSPPGSLISRTNRQGIVQPPVEYGLPSGWRVAWLPEELADHQFAQEGGMIAAKLAERDLPAGASFRLFPTTFGPVTAAANSDDVQGDALGYAESGFSGLLFVDDRDTGGGWYCVGERFSSVDLTGATTINSATLTHDRIDDNRADASNNILIDVEASNTPATFSSGSRPYARTVRNVARVTHEFPDSASTEVPNVAPLISDLIGAAGYTYTGDPTHAINFIFGAEQQYGNPDPVTRCIGYDTSHASGDPVELAIDFTASGGGPTPAAGFRSLLGVGR